MTRQISDLKAAGPSETIRSVGKEATQVAHDGKVILDSWGLVTVHRETNQFERSAYENLKEMYEAINTSSKITMKKLRDSFMVVNDILSTLQFFQS